MRALCEESGAEFSLCEGFLKGSVGTEDLAKKVAQICEKPAREINFTYEGARGWSRIGRHRQSKPCHQLVLAWEDVQAYRLGYAHRAA